MSIMLTKKEFQHLQQLANIKLTSDEEAKLGKQLDSIIQFLGQLDQIKISSTQKTKPGLTLRTIAWTRAFPDTKDLLRNVKHPVTNNSIVIKSVLG